MSIEFYEHNAEDFFHRTVNIDILPEHGRFVELLAPGARVLDAGCGSGRDALAFQRLGFRVTAMEASPTLAELARAHTGLPVEVMTFDQVAWEDAFDGIWTCASLLHVARADLPETMRRLRRALVPGGIWFMSFKYGDGERAVAGRRFTDLDEAGGQRLLEEVGGLQLLTMDVVTDGRDDHRGERWLSLFCRRS